MLYSKDEHNKEILIDESIDYQVMMEWEKPFMEALIDNLKPTGNVLEVGFGMGYSANQIQKYDIDSHTIIEQDEVVLEKLSDWSKQQKNPVNIIEGSWQEKLKELDKFDSVFFDDSPSSNYKDDYDVRTFLFYYNIITNHANPGCRMSWYVDGPTYWVVNSFIDWECKEFNIDIPDNCNYIDSFSKNSKRLYLPVITFKYGTITNVTPFAIGNSNSEPVIGILGT